MTRVLHFLGRVLRFFCESNEPYTYSGNPADPTGPAEVKGGS